MAPEPNDRDPIPSGGTAEDYRVTRARQVLAESRETDSIGAAARYWGGLEIIVESLLDVITERTAS